MLESKDPSAPIALEIGGTITSPRPQDTGGRFVYDVQVYGDQDLTVTYKGELVGIGGRNPVQVRISTPPTHEMQTEVQTDMR